MATFRNLTGFRSVSIQYGDTLQAIAARELNDATQWAVLIAINGLSYPYVTGDPTVASESILLYGSSILVPASATSTSSVSDVSDIFGTDLDLSGGGLNDDGNGDFAVITGQPNLIQAIENRIETPLKSLLFHLDYGCGASRLKGTGNGPTAGLLVAQYVSSALTSESRIAQVLSTTATVIGDSIAGSAKVTPITGRPVSVSFSV
jgi:phage baseplate assembly protein W